MTPPDTPLSLDLILTTAEEVLRRYGPDKATVIDVARALGVSHAAVYRYVATKSELRERVVSRWVETIMPPLRDIVALSSPAPNRLKQLFDTLIAIKRQKATEDPELFAAYRTLAADVQSVVSAHVDDLVGLIAAVIQSGIEDGSFRSVSPMDIARALLMATSRFHHPAHSADWNNPDLATIYNDLWQLLMNGLCNAK